MIGGLREHEVRSNPYRLTERKIMADIIVKNLYKTFETKEGKVEALKNINLDIEEGSIYGIIGMSGAGKSTLVRCLNYLERPTSGEVIVEGKELGSLTEKEIESLRSYVGMIFQNFNLLMQKTVIDNVCFPLRLKGVKKKEAYERARELLEKVGLSEKEKAYPAQLSGGQKQRVAIARALAMNPKILLCDEATSALDPQTTESILKLLKSINRELNITIVIITHQMSVVREICDRVAAIEDGEIVEDGTVRNVFSHIRDTEFEEKEEEDDVEQGSVKHDRRGNSGNIVYDNCFNRVGLCNRSSDGNLAFGYRKGRNQPEQSNI